MRLWSANGERVAHACDRGASQAPSAEMGVGGDQGVWQGDVQPARRGGRGEGGGWSW